MKSQPETHPSQTPPLTGTNPAHKRYDEALFLLLEAVETLAALGRLKPLYGNKGAVYAKELSRQLQQQILKHCAQMDLPAQDMALHILADFGGYLIINGLQSIRRPVAKTPGLAILDTLIKTESSAEFFQALLEAKQLSR